jgi:hypothetical protein
MAFLRIDPQPGLVGGWIHRGSKSLVGGGHQKPPKAPLCMHVTLCIYTKE